MTQRLLQTALCKFTYPEARCTSFGPEHEGAEVRHRLPPTCLFFPSTIVANCTRQSLRRQVKNAHQFVLLVAKKFRNLPLDNSICYKNRTRKCYFDLDRLKSSDKLHGYHTLRLITRPITASPGGSSATSDVGVLCEGSCSHRGLSRQLWTPGTAVCN